MQIVYFYDTYYHYAGFPIVRGRGVGPLCSPIMLILPPCNGLPAFHALEYAEGYQPPPRKLHPPYRAIPCP